MKAFLLALIARLSPWLNSALSEDNGSPSSMRLFVFMWHAPAMAIWVGLSICRREPVPIPESVVDLLLGLLGIKMAQKFGEAKLPAPTPTLP